jgi:hypothetical protein
VYLESAIRRRIADPGFTLIGEGEMKRAVALLIVCFGTLVPVNANAQQIDITDFVPWVSMAGIVSGITPTQTQNFSVVIYAHSQSHIWYIQPFRYVGSVPGRSWTSIDQYGKWSIDLADHDENVYVDCVAALLIANPVGVTDDRYHQIHSLNNINPRPVTHAIGVLVSGGLVSGIPIPSGCR